MLGYEIYYLILPVFILLLYFFFLRFINWKRYVFDTFGNSFSLGISHEKQSIKQSKFAFLMVSISIILISISVSGIFDDKSNSKHSQKETILVIDVSGSMLAKESGVSRLNLAKMAAKQYINNAQSDFGLIAFAGNSYLLSPITNNYEMLSETINNLDPNQISYQGSNLHKALLLALKSFSNSTDKQKKVIVLSDGEMFEGEPSILTNQFKDSSVSVDFVSLGSGEPILVSKEEYNFFEKDFSTASNVKNMDNLAKKFSGKSMNIIKANEIKSAIHNLFQSKTNSDDIVNMELSSMLLIISIIILAFFWKI